MKIALVCDFLTKFGGAQQVLLSLHEMYPEAPIYCLLYDEEGTKHKFSDAKVITSSLQKKPAFIRKRLKYLLPTFPKVVEQFDLSSFDVVISSNDSFAHGVITKPRTFHLSYCHTPMRYAWDWYHEYLAENKLGYGLKGLAVRTIIHNIRIWDRVAADRVDAWLANSENTRGRIRKYYQADATVVYPPVLIDKITPNSLPPEDFYLVVSRLEPYKRISLAVEAFNQLGKKLVVVGEGSDLDYLKSIAKSNIEFVGPKYDAELYDYYRRARAFIFPGEEDFGITPVESMAAGRPVVAFRKGGTLETVVEGKTGVFFDDENPNSLSASVLKLDKEYDKFTPENCRNQAVKFSAESFKKKIEENVTEGYANHLKQYGL